MEYTVKLVMKLKVSMLSYHRVVQYPGENFSKIFSEKDVLGLGAIEIPDTPHVDVLVSNPWEMVVQNAFMCAVVTVNRICIIQPAGVPIFREARQNPIRQRTVQCQRTGAST